MDNANITIPISQLNTRFKSVALRLPAIAGRVVVNFALDNFKRQGFLGNGIEPWRERKDPNKWGQKVKRPGRSLLVDTGRLRRSIRITGISWDEVKVGADVPYARAMNEGVRLGEIQQVKAYTRKVNTVAKMYSIKTHRGSTQKVQTGTVEVKGFTRRINQNIPARPFLAYSPYLVAQLQRELGAEILKALK